MDRLESLANQVSQITMYDIKSYYNQAKNMVLNLSEMEVKVRDATNDEPWGASSTLMNEIAQGTFNFQQFNEIMPAIYSRFMEKEAKQWRQIYKALQLLEYLIKNGSERTVDDARSHVSTIKMLRNFHYIDEKGKDQGINIRNRAREIVELLGDLDKIRAERRKAKTNKNKYTGVGNDGLSFSSADGGRYGGFGSETMYGGGYDRDYGGSSSYAAGGGGGSSGFRDDSGKRGFQEYDAGDDEDLPKRTSQSNSTRAPPSRRQGSLPTNNPAPPPPKAKAPEVDLLGGFDDESTTAPAPAPAPAPSVGNSQKALPTTATISTTAVAKNAIFDANDDFGDFEAAPTTISAQKPVISPAVPASNPTQPKPTVFEFLSQTQISPTTQGHNRQLSGGTGLGNMMQPMSPPMSSGSTMSPTSFLSAGMLSPSLPQQQQQQQPIKSPMANVQSTKPPITGTAPVKPAGGGFDDLWNLSLGSSTSASKTAANSGGIGGGKSILEMQKEKAQASIWGGAGAGGAAKPPGYNGGGFGDFGGTTTTTTTGGDDLLL